MYQNIELIACHFRWGAHNNDKNEIFRKTAHNNSEMNKNK
jgi:hypothetical protein